MTPSNGAGGNAATPLTAMAAMGQLREALRGQKSSTAAKLNPDPPPPRLRLTNQALGQRQTLRAPRRIGCLKRNRQNPRRRRRLRIPTFLSLSTTSGRTWLLLTSLQMLRAVNYIWTLSWTRRDPTPVKRRDGDTGGRFHRDAPESAPPTLTSRRPMEAPNHFQISH